MYPFTPSQPKGASFAPADNVWTDLYVLLKPQSESGYLGYDSQGRNLSDNWGRFIHIFEINSNSKETRLTGHEYMNNTIGLGSNVLIVKSRFQSTSIAGE